MSIRYALIRAAFDALALAGVPRLVRGRSSCRGVIFTLHRVLPDPPAAFSPNAILQVRPDFLDYAITRVRALGFDTVSLDEAIRRLDSAETPKPFVVFTFDDAYRDNLEHALPILRRHACPFTLYVPTALVDGEGEIWWQALEDIIAREPAIELGEGDAAELFDCRDLQGKHRTYDTLYWRMRKMPEDRRVLFIRELARRYGFDLAGQCRELIMTWAELGTFASEPLCTIGAHTVHHYELAKLSLDDARREIADSVRIIGDRLGEAPRHLSYPLGGPLSAGPREFALAAELGLHSAVTTRPGGLYRGNFDALTELPRISLNGLFQARRYVDVFATGAIFSRLPTG